jgi:hypothetical protein
MKRNINFSPAFFLRQARVLDERQSRAYSQTPHAGRAPLRPYAAQYKWFVNICTSTYLN